MLIYLGNKLSAHGFTPTSVETLGARLSEIYPGTITASDKKNKLLRLADMLYVIFRNRNSNPLVLIDTYSTSAFRFAYYSAKLCRLFNLKYITILRGGALPEKLKNSEKECRELFEGAFTNVAVSGYMEEVFRHAGYRTTIIPNYIDLQNYPFKLRNECNLKILWVRAFHQIYNPQLAIKIVSALRSRGLNASLIMAGPDKDGSMSECKRLAEKENLPVTFTGGLSKKDWIRLSAESDVFINTTNVDNTPVSVIEAMALGLPVISTNAGGMPYLFENNKEGILVEPENQEAFVTKLEQLKNNPDQVSKLSSAARQKASEWDWNNVRSLWETLISSATKN